MQWDKSERNTSEKSTFQTSPNWRANLPRLEGVLFQGLGPWRINFFHFRNHFLKIHAQQIPKMPNFKVLSHFRLRKWLSKIKKRVLTPSFSHLTFSSQMGTLSTVERLEASKLTPARTLTTHLILFYELRLASL